MKIATFNVNGINKRVTKHGATEAVKPSSPPFVGGQKLDPMIGVIVV
jgi:exonuclease III